ncbi:hypothetical protein NP233_g7040 [Leucocoprinus birnbaumii]|uniref:Cytochrome P450 n=1 Tax=Leucocoprinus birnbaumii TaxID=56174 RepID=A0AAD5VR27_9AGAR|nr:hypothetical protein NP233_g7040 [Leucocoprinus birnbaumii]
MRVGLGFRIALKRRRFNGFDHVALIDPDATLLTTSNFDSLRSRVSTVYHDTIFPFYPCPLDHISSPWFHRKFTRPTNSLPTKPTNTTSDFLRLSNLVYLDSEQLTFQTTIRALSCGEIADDHALVSRIKQLYDKLDTGTTPTTILLPWLPSWTMVNKLWSTKEIYDIIVGAVKQRQELLTRIGEGEKPQDTMQLLLDAGDDRMAVVGVSAFSMLLIPAGVVDTFIMGLLIAGARATASWLVTFLASHPEWARKARAEVEELVAVHTNVRFPGYPSPATVTSSISLVPSSPIATTPITASDSGPSHSAWSPHSPPKLNTDFDAAGFPGSPIISTSPTTAIQTPTSPLSASSIPSPTVPTAWSSRRHSYQSYPYQHQRKDSQCSKNKRKRCNSGSGSDGDSARKNGSRRGSVVVRKETAEKRVEKENEARIGFPDSDGEQEFEERVIGGPVSLLGDGSGRRRKDAIATGSKKASRPPKPLLSTVASIPEAAPTTQIPTPSPFFIPPSPPTPTTPPTISQALNQIPLNVWESTASTPVLDALIKETLRVAQPHTAMRRNVGPEFYIDGKRIETGDYVVYPFSDVHLDEDIYENAGGFKPERWLGEGNLKVPGKDVPFGYVGWGGGKSMCLGTRLAKVELKLIIAMFVLGFDLGIVDKKGNPLKPGDALPAPNWNDILLCRPEKEFGVKYESRKGMVL